MTKKRLKRLLAALVIVLSGSIARSGEYHVSPSGSDSSPGTSKAPWRTITKAAATMTAGDTCVVHEGVYRQTVRPAASGKAGKPIRFIAAPGESVVLTGTERVLGWSRQRGGVFDTPLGGAIDHLFLDGRMMVWARTPNAGDTPFKLNALKVSAEAGKCAIEGLGGGKDAWKGGMLWGMNSRRWVAGTARIASSDGGTVVLEGRGPFGKKKGTGTAVLLGVPAALDAEREWCQAGGKLHFIPPRGVDPNKRLVEVTQRKWAFDLSGRSHVEVRGFKLFAASINTDKADNCVIDGIGVRFASFQRVMKGGFNRDRRGVTAESEGLGIVLGGRNNTLRNSVIAYCVGDGISMYGSDNRIENCVVHDCNTSASDCGPITCSGTGHSIIGCTLFNAGRSIIVHRKFSKGRIERNHMFNAGLITNDLGATYTFQTDGKGTVIAYNVIHDVHCHTGVGIYVDNMSPNHIVHHNLCYNCDDCGIRLNTPTAGVLIYNNTLTGNGRSIDRWGSKGNHNQPGCVMANNIMTDSVKLGTGAKGHHNFVEAGPGFANPRKGDYGLAAGSPCIDTGVVIDGVTGKHEGKAPDIGCYERGRKPWNAGSTIPRKLWDETGW